jgi:hypothetical protein
MRPLGAARRRPAHRLRPLAGPMAGSYGRPSERLAEAQAILYCGASRRRGRAGWCELPPFPTLPRLRGEGRWVVASGDTE